jgi:hypothetical protein
MALLNSQLNVGEEIQPLAIPLEVEQRPQDKDALNLVLKDLNLGEYYILAKGMTVEWDRDDRLYLFRMPQAFWEGSSVPRSSLGMPLIFEHIESLMPQLMNALFSDNPPFAASPRPRTKNETAQAATEVINKQLKDIGFKEQARLGVKEGLQYGTGVWKYYWKRETKYRSVYKYAEPGKLEKVETGTVTIPTKNSRKVVEEIETYECNTPCLERVHIRFVVVDPGLREPDIRKAKYVIHRTYPTLTDLEKLRDQPGYTLPSREFLASLFEPPRENPERSLLEGRSTTSVLNTGVSSLDINMEFKAMPRWQDSSRNPNEMPLELLEYTTPTRVICVLNRKLVIKNDINPFNKINYFSVVCTDILDSWYGMGISRLLAGEQRLQQGVINSRLDDLALRLSGTFLRKRGGNTPTQQLRLRPGGIIDSDDEKGVQMIQYPPAITDAFAEVEASDSRAQRRTGASELVTQGTAPGSGQLGRTSTGINAAVAAVGARMGYLVEQICDNFFIPFLEAVHEMNCRWLPPDEIHQILTEELASDYEGDAIDLKNANIKFDMLAGAKLKAKMAMLQVAPTLVQILQAAPIIEDLTNKGKKVDWVAFMQAIMDSTDWPGAQKFIVDMTDEDKKALQAKNEFAQQNSQIALKHQATMEEIEMKGRAQAGTHIIKAMTDHMHPETQANVAKTMMETKQMAQQPPEGAGEAQ